MVFHMHTFNSVIKNFFQIQNFKNLTSIQMQHLLKGKLSLKLHELIFFTMAKIIYYERGHL